MRIQSPPPQSVKRFSSWIIGIRTWRLPSGAAHQGRRHGPTLLVGWPPWNAFHALALHGHGQLGRESGSPGQHSVRHDLHLQLLQLRRRKVVRRLIGRFASVVGARSRSVALQIGVNTCWFDHQQGKHIVRISGALFLIQLARLNFTCAGMPCRDLIADRCVYRGSSCRPFSSIESIALCIAPRLSCGL
jgi:hypothetical protein